MWFRLRRRCPSMTPVRHDRKLRFFRGLQLKGSFIALLLDAAATRVYDDHLPQMFARPFSRLIRKITHASEVYDRDWSCIRKLLFVVWNPSCSTALMDRHHPLEIRGWRGFDRFCSRAGRHLSVTFWSLFGPSSSPPPCHNVFAVTISLF